MSDITISPEARKHEEIIHAIQCKDGMVFRSEVQEQIQLAINTSTEALAKENAELREAAKFQEEWREDSSLEKWFPITAEELVDLKKQRDQLQARVKERDGQVEALIVTVERLRGERDALNARLAQCAKFMEHQAFCEFVILPGRFCNCGYDEIMQALTPPTPA